MPFKPTINPQTIEDTEYSEWFERDRSHVHLTMKEGGKTLISLWDYAVTEAFEDGVLPQGKGKAAVHRALFDWAMRDGITANNPIERSYDQPEDDEDDEDDEEEDSDEDDE